jgi:glycosyltransferase involved in cell wall biosynthesis
MKTLFVVNFPPYPPTSGTPLRVWQHINVLATQGPVYIFSAGGERDATTAGMPIAAGWRHFNSSEFSKSNGLLAKIARAILPRQYVLPGTFAQFAINRALRAEILQQKPDVIVLSHWKNACPRPLRKRNDLILDMHNIESLLGTGVRATVRWGFVRNAVLWRWRRRERALVRHASRVWVCSLNDVERLKRLDPSAPTPIVVPNAVDIGRYTKVREKTIELPEDLAERVPTIVYIGPYSYDPNRRAAMELINEIFPLILAKVPTALLLFVGDAPTTEMKQAATRDSRIVVKGRVDAVEPYLAAATVSIVPLRTGGGTRMKILECFAANIPVVSTSSGAEGLDVSSGREIRIAESARDLADNAIDLLVNERARREQVHSAFALVSSAYSWDALAQNIAAALTPSLQLRESALTRTISSLSKT